MVGVVEKVGTERSEGGKRRALVLAAYARIAQDGFEGLRTRDVAADVGVNIGTLHYYFPGKEALIRAAVHHMLGTFVATLSHEGSPADQLRGHLEGLRRLLKTDRELWGVSSEVGLRSARDPAIAGMVQRGHDEWFAYLRDLVARGVADGSLDGSLQPDGAAAAIVATIQGASMPSLGTFHPERVDLALDQLERWLGLNPRSSSERNGG